MFTTILTIVQILLLVGVTVLFYKIRELIQEVRSAMNFVAEVAAPGVIERYWSKMKYETRLGRGDALEKRLAKLRNETAVPWEEITKKLKD